MFKRTRVNTGVLLALGGALLAPVAVVAQDAQRIEITGSRIRSINAESPSPVQVITSQEIAQSGAVNIQELLVRNPAMGGLPTFSRTNSNFDSRNSGVTTIDLRNLGEERTLVLVNGKRFVAGVPTSSAVDLNAIPVDFIERVELLTGGASSVYGSDAVSGVINIILKKDFEGLSLDASLGKSDRGDDEKTKFGITWGANAAGGKGNVMLHFGYSKQGAVYARDRKGLAIDDISDAFLSGDVADMFKYTAPFYSSYAPQGRIFTDPGTAANPSVTFDAAGNVVPWSTNGPNGDGVGATGFNRQAFRTLAIPTSRYSLAGKGEFEFAENHRAYIESTFVTTKTIAKLEPFPLGSEDVYPVDGVVAAEFRVNGALVRNPLVPDAIYNSLVQTNADGARVYAFSRRLSDVGNRGSDAQTDTFRVASGVKGTVLGSWDYDVYGIYGSNKRSDISSGQFNVQSLRQALEAVADASDVDNDGNTTEAICLDATARAQGCVPVNIFGANTITPEALQWIQAPAFLNTFTTQRIAGGIISGEPFKLPAGPVGLAFGAEYRKEYSKSEFDALQQTGLNGSNQIPKTEGGFSVKELFAEAKVPLLRDAPFAKALSLNGAVRGSKYTTVGSTFSWNAGAEWAPNSTFKVRATRSLSTRAPNIAELYDPPLQDFPQVTDPCVGVTATGAGPNTSAATAAACRADPGVAANIAANGAFTLGQPDIQGTSGFDRGNPNLQEEKGRSTTVGLVITPTAFEPLRNFTFTIDYFDIKIADAIVSTERDFILSQCYGGDTSYCQFVTRRPVPIGAYSAGSLDRVDTAVSNSGGLSIEGVDLTAAWANRVGPGRLSARLAYTYLKDGSLIQQPGADPNPFVGEVGSPKHKATLGLGYNWGAFGVNTLFTYLGKQYLDDQFLGGFGAAPRSVSIPAKTYVDAQMTYTMGKFQYYFGIDNLFDTHNKRCDTNALIGGDSSACSTGTGTFAGDDAIGRRFYVGLRMSL